jgi:hypothetical protein
MREDLLQECGATPAYGRVSIGWRLAHREFGRRNDL